MGEVRRQIRPYAVDMICNKCGVGIMRQEGFELTSYPPQYQHKCENCGHTEMFDQCYPRIEYEVIVDNDTE